MAKYPSHSDTIVALATPHGCGPIAVIRVSGDEAFDMVLRVDKEATGCDLEGVGPPIVDNCTVILALIHVKCCSTDIIVGASGL